MKYLVVIFGLLLAYSIFYAGLSKLGTGLTVSEFGTATGSGSPSGTVGGPGAVSGGIFAATGGAVNPKGAGGGAAQGGIFGATGGAFGG